MTAFLTNAEIVEKLTSIEQQLLELKAGKIEEDIKTVSLFKAARLMSRGASYIISLIKSGKLPARAEVVNTKRGKVTRYRILLKDIQSYQHGTLTVKAKKDITGTFEEVARGIINEFQSTKNVFNIHNQ